MMYKILKILDGTVLSSLFKVVMRIELDLVV